jgi:DNA-directed RNA polymerase specialized sigma24 family protein
MAVTGEVTQWIRGLSQGDESAAQAIWQKYFGKLVEFARCKLEGMPRRVVDEEDVAITAMDSFYRGMAEHRFDKVDDREDLWKLLVTITARKACAQRRRHFADKRGGGQVRGESVFVRCDEGEDRDAGLAQVLGNEPTPELASMLAEHCRHMLDCLGDETLRQVALHKLEGRSNEEIAGKLGCVRRSVERKLERIREKWSREGLL